MADPRFILAGAAIGGWTQDPIESPLAASIGVGIGAFVGSQIEAEVVGTVPSRHRPNRSGVRNIHIDTSQLGQPSDASRSAARMLSRASRLMAGASNREDALQRFSNSINKVYSELNGGSSLDVRAGLVDEILGSSLKREEIAEKIKSAFGEDAAAIKKFRAAIVASMPQKGSVHPDGSYSLSPPSEMTQGPIQTLQAEEKEVMRTAVGAKSSLKDRESQIKKHLVEELKQPEQIAELNARNIATLTSGGNIVLDGGNLTFQTGQGEVKLPLERYTDKGTPYAVINNDVVTSRGHNRFGGLKNGTELLDTNGNKISLSYIDKNGNIAQTSVVNSELKANRFESSVTSLITNRLTGKTIFDAKDDAYKNVIRHASKNVVDKMMASGQMTSQSFDAMVSRGRLTDYNTTLSIRDGKFTTRQVGAQELKSIAEEVSMHTASGTQEMWEGAIKNPGYFNVGSAVRENDIQRIGLPETARGDVSYNRVEILSHSRNAEGERIFRELEKRGVSASGFNTGSIFSVGGLGNSGLAGVFGAELGDGAGLVSEYSIKGIETTSTNKVVIGGDNRVYSEKLRGAVESLNSGGAPIEFKSLEQLGIDGSGNVIRAPKSSTGSIIAGATHDKDGALVLDLVNRNNLTESDNAMIKFFGDAKSLNRRASELTMHKMALVRDIESKFNPDEIFDGKFHLSQKVADYLEQSGFRLPKERVEMGGVEHERVSLRSFADAFSHKRNKNSSDAIHNQAQLQRHVSNLPQYDILIRSDDHKMVQGFGEIESIVGSNRLSREEKVSMLTGIIEKNTGVGGGAQRYKDITGQIAKTVESDIASAGGDVRKLASVAAGAVMSYSGIINGKSKTSAAITYAYLGKDTKASTVADRILEINSSAAKFTEDAVSGEFDYFHKLYSSARDFMNTTGVTPAVKTAASTDLGVQRLQSSGGSTVSWMEQSAARSAGIQDITEGLGSRDQAMVYEALGRDKQNNPGHKFSDVFGDDEKSTVRRVMGLFNNDGDRTAALRELDGQRGMIKDGFLNVSLSRPGDGLVSLSIPEHPSPYSGAIKIDGDDTNYTALQDKLKRDLLYKEAALASANESGDEASIRSAEKAYDDSRKKLADMLRKTNSVVRKRAEEIVASNGADLVVRPADYWGLSLDAHLRNTDAGSRIALVNSSALDAMGLSTREQDASDLSRVYKRQAYVGKEKLDGIYELFHDDGFTRPVITQAAREPANGPENIKFRRVFYSDRMNEYKSPVVQIPEFEIHKGFTDIQTSSMDYDGDQLRMRVVNNVSQENMSRMSAHNNIQLSNAEELIPLNPKMAAKSQESVSPAMESADRNLKGMLQLQSVKTEAPWSTSLAEAMNLAVEMKIDSDRRIELQKLGAEDIDIRTRKPSNYGLLEDDVRKRVDEMLEEFRVKKYNLQETVGKVVETGLKSASHTGADISITQSIYEDMRNGKSMSEISSRFTNWASSVFVDNAKSAYGEEAASRVAENIRYIGSSIDQFGQDAMDSPGRHLGVGGVEAALSNIESVQGNTVGGEAISSTSALPEQPEGAKINALEEAVDSRKTLLASIKKNRGKIFGGIAGLAATSILVGRGEPDMQAPLHSAPAARNQNVLPPLSQERSYITTPTNRSNGAYGTIDISGTQRGNVQMNRISDMFLGNTAGRTTIRYQQNSSY